MPPMRRRRCVNGSGRTPDSIPMPRSTTSKRGCSPSGVTSSAWRSPTGRPRVIARTGQSQQSTLVSNSKRSFGRESRRAYVKTTRRQSDSPRQGLARRRAGLPRTESVPQHDPHALSGDRHSLTLRSIHSAPGRSSSICLRNHSSSISSAQSRGAWSRRPSTCSSTRSRIASGRNSPRPRQTGSSRTPRSSSFSSLAEPAADRDAEAHLGAGPDRRRQEVGERLLEHDLGAARAEPELAVDRHRGGQLDDPVVQERPAALEAVRHAGQVDLDQQVAGQVGQEVGDHGAGDVVAARRGGEGRGQERGRVGLRRVGRRRRGRGQRSIWSSE